MNGFFFILNMISAGGWFCLWRERRVWWHVVISVLTFILALTYLASMQMGI